MSDPKSIREAQDAAVEQVQRLIKDWGVVNKGRSLETLAAARYIASGVFNAIAIPADYMAGYRDAMSQVQAALGPVLARAERYVEVPMDADDGD